MNLVELAEAQLGPGATEGRAEFLRSCRLIADYCRLATETVESIVGTLYWLAVRPLPEPRRPERRIFDKGARGLFHGWGEFWPLLGPSESAERVVVAHGDPVRMSLVLLDPDYSGSQPGRQEIMPEDAVRMVHREFDRENNSWARRTIQQTIEDVVVVAAPWMAPQQRSSFVPRFREAMLAYARLQPGGALLVRRPQLVPTSDLIPATPVCTRAGVTSTAGMLIEASRDELMITAANHAVADDTVEVAGIAAEVVGRHEGTDSCVLRVPYTPDCPLFARARQLRHHRVQGLPPRPYEDASFVGATSGPVDTKVRAHDPSILFRMPEFASKLYTDCDTVDGDSGAALYDSGGKVIGFAAYRTAYGEDPSYSVWIWAKQVIEQHKLDRL